MTEHFYQGAVLKHMSSPFKYLLAGGWLQKGDTFLGKQYLEGFSRTHIFKNGAGLVSDSFAMRLSVVREILKGKYQNDLPEVIPNEKGAISHYTLVGDRQYASVWFESLGEHDLYKVVLVRCGGSTYGEYVGFMDMHVCKAISQVLEKALLWKRDCIEPRTLYGGVLRKGVETLFTADNQTVGVVIEYFTLAEAVAEIEDIRQVLGLKLFEKHLLAQYVDDLDLPPHQRREFSHHYHYRKNGVSFYTLSPVDPKGRFVLEYIEVASDIVEFHNQILSFVP